jgi:hypothetical protein
VGRQPRIPPALTRGPFTSVEAQRAGLTRRQLAGSNWRRVSFGQYAWAGLRDSPDLILASVYNRLPAGAAFSGHTAAWLHGLNFPPCDPVEATFPKGRGISALSGVALRRTSLPDSDVVTRRGFPTTSAVRTVFDLAGRPPLVEAVVAVDMALHAGLVQLPNLRELTTSRAGSKGAKQFRRVLVLAEPLAESPMETRMRMKLVLGGLTRPEARSPCTTNMVASWAGRTSTIPPRDS